MGAVVDAAKLATDYHFSNSRNKFTFKSDWATGTTGKSESLNWFGVFRGYNYQIDGNVTCDPMGRDFVMQVRYKVFKDFDFDAGETYPLPVYILGNGSALLRLHETGLAQNFVVTGTTTATIKWSPIAGQISPEDIQSIRRQAEKQFTAGAN